MELIASINSAINGFVWGVPMLVLLVGGGILLTIRNRGVQFRKFGYAMKNTIGKIFKKGEAKEGEITPFQAMSTALAGTVGTGLAAFGIGNAVQVGNITDSVNTVILSFNPDFSGQSTVNVVLGLILVVLTAIVLFGGIKRLGAVTEKLVPFMAVVYIVACVIVLVYYGAYLPAVFSKIFTGAFSPEGVTGGAVGSVILVITWGVKRGVFSNEAGLGSAPMAHAATSETDPVKQGLYGIFEVFMDTIVICSLSGLTILCAAEGGALNLNIGTEGTTALNAQALGSVFTQKGGAIIIAVGLALFAFSTILSWALYGTRCCEFLFGSKAIKPYQIIFLVIIFVGATMELSLAWSIADTLNGLMAIPNLIALVGLSGVVVRETKRHFSEKVNK